MWMNRWDDWRGYIKEGGGGSWPRDAFESLLDYVDEVEEYLEWLDGKNISRKDAEQERSEAAKTKSIFYGNPSRQLWDKVNSIPGRKMRYTIYHLCCKLQELESRLEAVER